MNDLNDVNDLSIKDLYKIQERKETERIEIYNKIINKFNDKIKYLSKMNRVDFYYKLPDIIYGLPLYDKNACICYIIYKYRIKGFNVKYIYPNAIHINWDINNKTNIKKLN